MSKYNEFLFDISRLIDTLYQKRQSTVHLLFTIDKYKRVVQKGDMYRLNWLKKSCMYEIEDIDAVYDTLVTNRAFAEARHFMRLRKYMKY